MSYAAIVTNMALICFTSNILGISYPLFNRWLLFLILEHLMIGLKLFLMLIIDDVPEDILFQQKRQELYVAKVIANQEDDALEISEYEFEVEGKPIKKANRQKPSLDVKATDYEYYVATEKELHEAEGPKDIDFSAQPV
jgi:hypothetical protein